MKITVKDTVGRKDDIEIEIDEDHSIEDIIEVAADHWTLPSGAYQIKFGKKQLQGQTTVMEAGITDNDVLELIPDPDAG